MSATISESTCPSIVQAFQVGTRFSVMRTGGCHFEAALGPDQIGSWDLLEDLSLVAYFRSAGGSCTGGTLDQARSWIACPRCAFVLASPR
jgi:hypothetical protein